MNKHLYRIVFNHALGVFQVVAEIVRRPGRGGPKASAHRASEATVPAMRFALWVALGWVSTLPAFAQVVADPAAPGNQRPTVLQAPNGTPLINIQTPSAAGVSRNTYRQFDVDANGAILNNSRTNTQTQLGGWVQGNPWLATGTARVILNEVNGPASQLNGYVEVAGQRAEVVIANPAGIAVNGGGFINASRVTLTTGAPLLNGGALDGYRVGGGLLSVAGAGLDTSGADYTDLIARAIQVNAGIWAQQLQVTTGTNTVSADHAQVTATPPAAGTMPAFALDVGALGGMYSGKIALLATESGVGVRNAGTLGAQAGELTVTVDGRLENTGSLQAKTDTQVTASGGMANAGTISAVRELVITTPQDLDNSGGTLNAQRIEVNAQSLRNRDGAIEQTGVQALALNAGALSNRDGGRIGEIASGPGTGTPGGGGQTGGGTGTGSGSGSGGDGGNNGGGGTPTPPVVPLADGALNIAGLLDNDGGRISAGGGIALATNEGLDNAGGQLGLRSLTITQGDLLNQSGTLTVTGSALLDVGTFDNDAGTFQVNDVLSLQAGSLSNRDGDIQHGGKDETQIQIAGTLDNTGGTLASNAKSLGITAGHLINEHGTVSQAGTQGLTLTTDKLDGNQGTIATAGALTLTATDIAHRQAVISATQLTVNANNLDNTSGQIIATGIGVNTLAVTQSLDNSSGTLASNGDLSISTATFTNTQGLAQQAGSGELEIDAATVNGEGGTLLSNGGLTITGQTTNLRGARTSAKRIAIDTNDLITADGQLTATGADTLLVRTSNLLDNTGGKIAGNGSVDLRANTFINTSGVLQAAGTGDNTVHVTGVLDNRQGQLLTAGNAQVHAGAVNNQAGVLQVAGLSELVLGVDGLLDNTQEGVIASGGDLQLTAGDVDNRTGVLGAGGALEAVSAAGINNASGVIQAAQGLKLTGNNLINTAGSVIGAQVQVNTRGGVLDNDAGTLASVAGNLDIDSGALHNTTGRLQSAGDLRIDTAGQALTNQQSGADGGIISTGQLQISSGALANQAGVVFAQGNASLVATTIDNTNAGLLGSAADLTVQGTSLSNAGGTVQAGHDAVVQLSGVLDNQAGLVAAGNVLSVTATTVDNRNTLSAGSAALGLQATQLQLDASSLDNRQGQVIADTQGRITLTGLLDNGAGLVSSSGQLDLTADAVTNTAGTLLSGGNQTLTARALSGDGKVLSQGDATLALQEDFLHTGEMSVNGTLSLTTAGDVRNQATMQAGNLDLQAANIDNTLDGELTSMGTTHLAASGTLTNRGLIDGAITHIEAATVDNLGTGRVYGDHVAIEAGELRNHAETLAGITLAATIAARQQLDLGVGTLTNSDQGLIYSDGNAAIGGALDADLSAIGSATVVNNLSSTIEVSNNLDLQSQAVNNIRQNVVITQTTTTNAPARLDQPDWRNNGGNSTSDIRSTSNYEASEVYYLHPDDILEDTPYITPDGYTVHRAVIRLTPQTSAYFFGRGGLYAAKGERSRLAAQDGTVTIYYFGRQDNQVNPDQVSTGADNPFLEISAIQPGSPAFSYVDDNLTYSSGYGTCTTNCVQLWAQYDYDPQQDFVYMQRGSDLGQNEQYRIATQTITEDMLAAGAGAEAVIHAGGAMRVGTDALVNRYGQIAAGGNLAIEGLTTTASVTNVGQTLYRTYDFNNVTHAYNGSTRVWSNPAISEQTGQVGGAITSGGTLTVDVGDLSNLNEGRDAPNVQDGSTLATLGAHAPGGGPAGPGVPSGTGPGNATGDTASNTGGTTPDNVAAGTLNTQLPTSSLFAVASNNNGYLIETDPRFADYRNWLGSDYLLSQLGFDPANVHKRLGDGYYEQKLIREQIGQLTGRRFLTGYSNDEDQFRALMNAGALFAKTFGLRPGVALSAAQMAQLTSDIVWLVEQTITLPDGSTATVLVPQVYVRIQAGDLHENGALLAGANVNLKLSGNLLNTGDIAGRQVVAINAANINNLAGGAISGQSVGLQAIHDINVIGSTVTAGEVLNVQAGGNVTVASTTQTQQGGGYRQYDNTNLNRVAGLYVTNPGGLGVLNVNAGGDVTLQAAQVANAGSNGITRIAAGGDLNLTTLSTGQSTNTTAEDGDYWRSSTTTQVGTTVQGAGSVVLQAGHDVNVTGAQVNAGDALVVSAGNDLNSLTATDVQTTDVQDKGKKHSLVASASDQTVKGSQFTAGGNIALQAGNDLTLQAATVVSEQGGIALAAGRDVNLTAATEQHVLEVDASKKKSGFLSSKTTTTHDKVVDDIAVGTVLSGETVQVAAGRDLTTQAAQIASTGDVLLAAGRNIGIGTAVNTHTEEHDTTKTKSGLFSTGGVGFTIGKQKVDTTADISETVHSGSLIGSTEGRVDIVAGGDVTVNGSDVLSKEGIGILGQNVTIQAVENSTSVTETQKFKQAGLNVSLKGGVVDTAMAVYSAANRAGEVKDDRLAALYVAKAGQTLFSNNSAGLNSFSNTGQQFSDLANTTTETKASGGSGISLRIGIGASSSSSNMDYNATTASGSRIASEGNVVIHATGDQDGNGGDLTVTGSKIEGDNVTLAAHRDLLLQSMQETSEQVERNKASSGEIGITIGTEAGIGVYVSASAAKGKGDGNGTTYAETTVDAANTLTLISGRDTTLEGAQARGETVLANVGRDLTLTSQQDSNSYDRKDQAGGIDVAVGFGGATVSGYYNQSEIDSNYQSVNQQTGIQAGAGGFDIEVGGHTQLTGAAIASTANPALNHLSTNSLSATDLNNRAEYEATSFGFSASGGTGGGSFSPNLAPPQSEEASSTTRAGISAGNIDIRNGDNTALASIDRSVTTLQQEGLKEIFDEQAVNERMEMGQVAGEVGMRAAGDLAQQMGWEEGSKEKVILHGVVGAAIAALGGGNALQGLAGAAASQLATLAMQGYLRDNNIDPNSSEGRTLMELGSLAVGAAVGGGSGAATALGGEQFNRQLHPDEVDWVKKNAESFAQQICDCSKPTPEQVQDAQNRLMAQAFTLVDEDAVHLSQENSGWDGYFDNQAADYLFDHPAQFDWGQGFVPDEHFSDPHYNGELLASDPDAFRDAMNGMILGSNVPRASLQETYGQEFLRWGSAQVGESSQEVGLFVGGSALLGAVPAVVASGGIAATTAAWKGLPSLVQAALGGAGSGGFFYTAGVTGSAGMDSHENNTPFGEAFSERFSWAGFTSSAVVGAAGGIYVRQMLTWAGLPYGMITGWTTTGGAVVNANKIVVTQAVNRAANSAIETHGDKNQEGSDKP